MHATMPASSSSSSSPELTNQRQPLASSAFSFKYANQAEVLEDLSSRFILNLPDEELASVERICMQIEQAHWYYEDFIREENPKFPTLPLKKFSEMLFNSCPLLQRWSHDHEQAFSNFMQYKTSVPVCGAIMLNDKWDKCVLVKGWKSSSGWGFPKGKINQDEPTKSCAIREVLEETGYDLTQQISPEDFVEMSIKDQRITLYIVPGVPENYPFQTKTRKEISKIEWFNLADLPTWRRNKQVLGKFYLITPFVPSLKEFIRANKPRRRQQKSNSSSKAPTNHSFHLDGEATTDGDDSLSNAFDASNFHRDAQGSSSSSADNGELETPSPQSVEAVAVVDHGSDVIAEVEGIADSHFARLLSNLSLSASAKEASIDIASSCSPAASSTPTPADSPVKTVQPFSTASNVSVTGHEVQISLDEIKDRPSSTVPSTVVGLPVVSDHATPLPSEAGQSQELQLAPDADRRLKHLALLESVANESAASACPPTLRAEPAFMPNGVVHHGPPPPSSVPPPSLSSHPWAVNNRVSGWQSTLPNGFHVNVPAQVQIPSFNDPIRGRPMTSNAIIPPTAAQRRLVHHGSAMSLHQGNLLSILGSSAAAANRMQRQLPPSGVHPPLLNGCGPQMASEYQSQQARQTYASGASQSARSNTMGGLAVIPPHPRSVQNGPMTAPLAMQPQQPVTNGVVHAPGMRQHLPNKSQLLSILTPNGLARPPTYPSSYPAPPVL